MAKKGLSKARTRAKNPPRPRPGKKGRPPYIPTDKQREQVRTLVGIGMREDEIAKFLDPPCTANTLRLHFRTELDQGLLQAKAQTLGTLHRLANGAPAQYYPVGHPNAGQLMTPAVPPDRACLIFKCKTSYGMREVIRLGGEQGPGAKPVSIRIEDMTEDQLVALVARLEGIESKLDEADNEDGAGDHDLESADED